MVSAFVHCGTIGNANLPQKMSNLVGLRQMVTSSSSDFFQPDLQLVSASSSSLVSLATETTGSMDTEPIVFDAVLPDTSALIAMGSILVLCIVAASVWANEVVPVSRTKLAISKNKGQVKGYLDELKSVTNEENISAMETELEEGTDNNMEIQAKSDTKDNRAFERWLFADWLRDNKSAKKPSAVPFLKDAKWNSGDNPVLVTSGLLMLCVLFASITERAGLMGVR